ncbi:phosphatase PAP2 family protein [Brassicibacter mesophilus]|uniref:phosphatase PAP2 family protein n=1 Tax=Brassicibacter mesophilus TaxID=745119 RepID=UPI003D1C0AA3
MRFLGKCFVFGDKKLFYFINKNISCSFLNRIMPFITELGGAIFSSILPLLLIIINAGKSRILGIEILASLSVSQVFVQLLKRMLTRERPYNILQNINTFGIKLKDYSFPSGHTTASFSMATILSLYMPQMMMLFVIAAFVVGISRIYLAVHYPSDVFVGIILGTASSFVTHSYFLNYMA